MPSSKGLIFSAAAGTSGALSALAGKAAGTQGLFAYTAMAAFNVIGMLLFTASLRHTSSSFQATATAISTNIVASALLGLAFFSETLPLQWWIGAMCLCLGIFLIQPREAIEKKNE